MAVNGVNLNSKPLTGMETITVDDKGRITLSKQKRDRLGEDFAMYVGPEGYIELVPLTEWLRIFDMIQRADPLNPARRRLERLIMAMAADDLNFDTQGRLTIPQWLREAAKIRSEIRVVGCGARVELWSIDRWETANEDVEGFTTPRLRAIDQAYADLVHSSSVAERSHA